MQGEGIVSEVEALGDAKGKDYRGEGCLESPDELPRLTGSPSFFAFKPLQIRKNMLPCKT